MVMRLQDISRPRNSLSKLALSCLVSMEYSNAFKDFRFSDVTPPISVSRLDAERVYEDSYEK